MTTNEDIQEARKLLDKALEQLTVLEPADRHRIIVRIEGLIEAILLRAEIGK